MKSSNKLILILGGGLAVALAMFGLLLRPNLSDVNTLYLDASAKKTEQQRLADQILAYKNSVSDLAVVADKDKILNSILERDNLQVAIVEVETAAAKSGVTSSLTIHENFDAAGKPASSAQPVIMGNREVDEVAYDLNISGAYPDVIEFLQYMENLPHFTEIYDLTLSATTSGTNQSGIAEHGDKVNANLRGVFMVRKEAQK